MGSSKPSGSSRRMICLPVRREPRRDSARPVVGNLGGLAPDEQADCAFGNVSKRKATLPDSLEIKKKNVENKCFQRYRLQGTLIIYSRAVPGHELCFWTDGNVSKRKGRFLT